jgi:hypothetical protein
MDVQCTSGRKANVKDLPSLWPRFDADAEESVVLLEETFFLLLGLHVLS